MLKYKLQEEKEHLTSAQIAKSTKTNPAYILRMKLLCWMYTGQWSEKSLCFILILIPTQSVEYTDNNKETVTFMENYELFQSLESPLLHLNLFNHFLRRPVFSDPRTSS